MESLNVAEGEFSRVRKEICAALASTVSTAFPNVESQRRNRGQPAVKDVPPFRGSLQKISLISPAKLLRPLSVEAGGTPIRRRISEN